MRRPIKKRSAVKQDRVYQSDNLAKFINYLMWAGKKDVARRVVYGALDAIKDKEKTDDPLEVFETALKNTAPNMEVRSRRVGGANYQVPMEVRPTRRSMLSMKWIINAARSKSGRPMADILADEIILASKNEGEAVRKRETTHKMAEANKAFAHFAWN